MGSAQTKALTNLLISPSDLKRARRELDDIDDFLHQSGLRQGGKAVKLPTISRVIEALASDNGLNMLKKTERDQLKKFLTLLLQKAPVLHISFASEPSGAFLGKLVMWLRANIHPQVMVSVGLQPSIAAGCIVRTANKQFDFSLRASFDKQTEVFVASMQEGLAEEAAAAAAAPAVTNTSPPAASTVQAEAEQPVGAAK